MKSLRYLFIVTILLIACSLIRDCACNRESKPQAPTVITGSSDIVKPENTLIESSTNPVTATIGQNVSKGSPKTSFKAVTASGKDYTEVFREALDDAIKKAERDRAAFAKEKDSLKRAAMYANAIAPRLFTHTFNEKDLTATVSGISSGTVEDLKIDYTVTHPAPQKYYYIMADGKVGVNTDVNTGLNSGLWRTGLSVVNSGLWYAGISVVNDGKESYSGGVTSVGAQKYITLGYSTRLFKIKKKK